MTSLRRIDINLLAVLDAILHERNLTRAGERLGVSQPAISGALGRLRQLYGDPLLVRTGGSFQLSTKAEAIQPLVRQAMVEVARALDLTPTFDPGSSARTFLISASDYVLNFIATPLLAAFAREAPGATVEFNSLPDDSISPIDLLRRDVVIAGADRGVPGKQQRLFTDRFVTVVDAANPRLRDGHLTLNDIAELPHVRATFGGRILTPADEMLRSAGISPTIALSVRGFLPVAPLVQGTGMVGHVPQRIAALERRNGIAIAQTPLPSTKLVEAAHWHPSKSDDPALLWLLQMLQQAARVVEIDRPI